MRTCCFFVRPDLAAMGASLFEQSELYGMKSDLYMYVHLKHYLHERNILFNTQTFIPPESADIIICLNETSYFETYKPSTKNTLMVLILTEPPVYNQIDWSEQRHKLFHRIFTYDSDLVKTNPSKYVKIVFPIDFNMTQIQEWPTRIDFANKTLVSLVAATFSVTPPDPVLKSLLYVRYQIFKWYSTHAPSDLDFFSRTLPIEKCKNFKGASYTNAIHKGLTAWIAQLIFKKNIARIYRGAIPAADKVAFLNGYKFSFCFENSEKINGLISEKIFECFFAKTIPIYLGAPDITTFVPKDTFIAYQDFQSIQDLHNYLVEMPYEVYRTYLENAKRFLDAEAAHLFTTKHFSETIFSVIKN